MFQSQRVQKLYQLFVGTKSIELWTIVLDYMDEKPEIAHRRLSMGKS